MKIIEVGEDISKHAAEIFHQGVHTVIRRIKSERISRTELRALQAAGLSVVLVLRCGRKGHSMPAARQDGDRLIEIAEELGLPDGAAVYCDIEHPGSAGAGQVAEFFHTLVERVSGRFRVGLGASPTLLAAVCRIAEPAMVRIIRSELDQAGAAFVNAADWALLQGGSAVWSGRNFRFRPNISNPALPDFGQHPLRDPDTVGDGTGRWQSVYRVTARTGLALRSGPGVGFPIRRQVRFGELVIGVGLRGEWIAVDLVGDGRLDGHLHADFLELLAGGFPGVQTAISSPVDIAFDEMARGILGPLARDPHVFMYHRYASHGDTDAVPWASAFLNYCVTHAGLTGTDSKSALSWHERRWGADVTDAPQHGDIAVYSRTRRDGGGPKRTCGHVGFYLEGDAERVSLLGGTLSGRIGIGCYPRDGNTGGYRFRLMSVRRPLLSLSRSS